MLSTSQTIPSPRALNSVCDMALRSSRTQARLLCNEITGLVRDYGSDNSIICLAYCKIGERIVGSFSLDENDNPQVCLANDKGETMMLSASDFNVSECRALREAVTDTIDAINYRRCCDGISRQTELATRAEKYLSDKLNVEGNHEACFLKNRYAFDIGGNKVDGYSYNPEKNKDLGGEYSVVFNDGTSRWLWDFSNSVLEQICSNIKCNVDINKSVEKGFKIGF